MSDPPLTLGDLARFHREVIAPDFDRIAGDAETRLAAQVGRVWDALLGMGERLETGYLLLKAAVARVEERLEPPAAPGVLRGEVEAIRRRVDALTVRVEALERRVPP